MKIFSYLYDKVLAWSRHPRATLFLGGVSFAESSFFPIPPDVILAPMSLARPERAWWYATITTVASVLGGLFGYLIGYMAFELVEPLIARFGYDAAFAQAQAWFAEWGFWAIFIAGFSPIPYKVFTVCAGMIGMALLPFVLASAIGRGARFFLVAGLMRLGGPDMQHRLRGYVDGIGWATVGVLTVGLVVWKLA